MKKFRRKSLGRAEDRGREERDFPFVCKGSVK